MLNKGITIKARIGLTMAFLAALLVAIGVFGLFGMSRTNNAYKDTFTDAMPSASAPMLTTRNTSKLLCAAS